MTMSKTCFQWVICGAPLRYATIRSVKWSCRKARLTPIRLPHSWRIRNGNHATTHSESVYQNAPWVPQDAWEFTPRHGVTHVRSCDVCAKYKEHCIIAEALAQDTGTVAWKNRDKFERDLVCLGWTLALKASPGHSEQATRMALGKYIDALERRNQELTLRNEALHRTNNRLLEQVKGYQKLNDDAFEQCKELQQELECSQLESSLRGGEANLWLSQYKFIEEQYTELKAQSMCKRIQSSLPKDEDVEMHSGSSGDGSSDQIRRAASSPGSEPIAHCAAARDQDDAKQEREFRSAHNYRAPLGLRPRPSSRDRHCMAVHVKINGLDAYALLDSGCTTVSVTHDFARVANLKVTQLENPVTLQLGTVGSRSMINFGTRTRIELGPIKEDDAYLDVVNLDRYDVIIGTPFMRKHKLVLDFGKDFLNIRGQPVPTLTAGQEDLLLAKKRIRSEHLAPSKVGAPRAAL